MKRYICVFAAIAFMSLSFVSCSDEVLDRPQLTKYTDDTFWRNENDIRLYCNEYYPQYFTGYNAAFGVVYTPLRGYYINDDLATPGTQDPFPSTTPATVAQANSPLQGADWRTWWNGEMWNFAWVRKSNILLERLDRVTKPNLTDEAYKHWTSVGRFFRAFEYYRLTLSFGDVPYYDAPVDETDLTSMYKDRDPRGVVMDAVYDDLKYAIENSRVADGDLTVNKYVIAGYTANIMLFEGTWQKYHNMDADRARKYLELAVSAAEVVMNSGKYSFARDFRSLFGSEDLKGHPEVIMYRNYTAGQTTHCLASYSNGVESQDFGTGNLALIKSFICNDGLPYQQSAVPGADDFSLASLAKTRDPRFESTFFDFISYPDQGGLKPITITPTLLYSQKFTSREGATYYNRSGELPDKYKSSTNTNDAPCLRLAEVALAWIEAKAALAESYGGAAVTQADLDKSVNAIRSRPLDQVAIDKGVQQTKPLLLAALPDDPARDADVSPLMWEIRRERRMEFVHEYSRYQDIRRWKKIEYMDNNKYPDTMFGPWVNISAELPTYLAKAYEGVLTVRKADGALVTYNGSNAADMVGFFRVNGAKARNAFGDEVYLSPVGKNEIQSYKDKGFTLTQTPGWENR
ncbi:MAG: RagB/SusD family nutrient uptake outer membrane protein [Tannerella sp.]|jgi:hypothetical protein|nr:RagB/SusD family nutrient uptake outer membrane protein [Tannerella sp.]